MAQLDGPPSGAILTYLTTDHLGTPILASDASAGLVWGGGFEPFGRDQTSPSAQQQGVFLRGPGQWEDAAWTATTGAGVSYNLNRWYEASTGKYSQPDPLAKVKPAPFIYSYANSNTLRFTDPKRLDTAGCTVPPSVQPIIEFTQCQLTCCGIHDACYSANSCTQGSWNPFGCESLSCKLCNLNVVTCLFGCALVDPWHTPASWVPNGPYSYYCPATHRFVSIPGESPDVASARRACTLDNDPPDCSGSCSYPYAKGHSNPGDWR